MRKQFYWRLLIVAVLAVLAGLVVWPNATKIPALDQYTLHEGLDLKGGTQLTYQLDTTGIAKDQTQDAIDSVQNVITNRVNGLGVSEAVVQPGTADGVHTLIVQLPGVNDIDQAKSLIGTTAKLEFWEQSGTDQTGNPSWQPTELTGNNLKHAQVAFDQQTGNPYISLSFDADGAKQFGDITKRNLGKPVAIVLDNQLVTEPTVQSEITSGEAQITGQFTVLQAKTLAIQLNAGALKVPLNLIEQQTVGATLGATSVRESLLAGMIGLALVMLFMVLYYGGIGVLASVALALYTLFMIALIQAIPITMSLAGIAGVILSIGMAVDANILIFERMKEERREGKSVSLAVDDGFRRAWQSIRDSNVSSLITAAILYATTSGLIRGFAITLALGIGISLFTAIFVTRTFLKLALRERKG